MHRCCCCEARKIFWRRFDFTNNIAIFRHFSEIFTIWQKALLLEKLKRSYIWQCQGIDWQEIVVIIAEWLKLMRLIREDLGSKSAVVLWFLRVNWSRNMNWFLLIGNRVYRGRVGNPIQDFGGLQPWQKRTIQTHAQTYLPKVTSHLSTQQSKTVDR